MNDSGTMYQALRDRAEHALRTTRYDVSVLDSSDVQQLVHELQVHHVELDMQNESLLRTQLELEQSKDLYQELFDHAPLGYVMLDYASMVVRANLVAQQMLGVSGARLVGQPFAAFVAGDELVPLVKHLSHVKPGAKATCELRLGESAGVTRVRMDTSVRPDASGRLVVLTDISDRARPVENDQRDREADPRLRIVPYKTQSHPAASSNESARSDDGRSRDLRRLESLDLVAAGIAHHFNDLLAGLLGDTELLLKTPAVSEASRERLSSIQRAGRDALDLTRQLQVFADQAAQGAPFDFVSVASDAFEVQRADVPPGVLIELRTESGPFLITAVRKHVHRIVCNLIRHAVEAVGPGGRITLHVRLEQISAADLAEIHPSSDASPGLFALLLVQDSGPYVATQKARMFDPFFTSRLASRVFDLATCSSAVRSYRGLLLVHGQPGQGTSVEVAFPLASSPG
jgi:signal transduction histidine kinase